MFLSARFPAEFNLSRLNQISGKGVFYRTFYGCQPVPADGGYLYRHTNVNFENLTTIKNTGASTTAGCFCYTFFNPVAYEIHFPVLTSVTNNTTSKCTFYRMCHNDNARISKTDWRNTQLKCVSFDALPQIEESGEFQ